MLCPAGADGPDETWLAADGFKAVINVRAFAQLSASGIRIGNAFAEGRGTTGFRCVLISHFISFIRANCVIVECLR